MTFLPIVERELRVGARRRFTYWSRLMAGAFALLIFGILYALALASKGMVFTAGQAQFAVLKWLCFVFAGATGIFLTSDSLSEEKREGTLGLLFLTDLRGHDVVLGKLISCSVRAFYCLLAAFPIMALTLLSGGVTAGEFWRAILVICNTLFVSISIGLLASGLSRDAVRSINATIFIGLILFGGLPFLDFAMAGWNPVKFEPRLSLASPVHLFSTTGAFMPWYYWPALGIQHVMGWAMLVICSVITPRAWQEKASGANGARQAFAEWMRFGGHSARVALRRRLLEKNPVLWLAMRDRWLRGLVWVVVIAAALAFCWGETQIEQPRRIAVASAPRTITVTNSGGSVTTSSVTIATPSPVRQIAAWFQSLAGLAFTLWIASQACRFFVEAVRNGAMELILVTPLGPREIVKAQGATLLRTFVLPGIILLAMQVVTGLQTIQQMKQSMAGTPAIGFNFVDYMIANYVVAFVTFITGALSLGWYGMWMGLTTRKLSIAVLKTVAFVSILPAMAIGFVQGFSMLGMTLWHMPAWLAVAFPGVLHVGKDAVFILWSRRRLLTRFRDAVASDSRVPLPGVIPPPLVAKAVAPVPGG